MPQVTSSNIYNIAITTKKKLVLMVGDEIEMIGRMNLSTITGRFKQLFSFFFIINKKKNYY